MKRISTVRNQSFASRFQPLSTPPNIDRISIEAYRASVETSIEHLSNSLSNIDRTDRSNTYRTVNRIQIEHLQNIDRHIYRTSIETSIQHRLNIYRTSIEHISVRFTRFGSHGSVITVRFARFGFTNTCPASMPRSVSNGSVRTILFTRFGSHGSKWNRKSQIESRSNV